MSNLTWKLIGFFSMVIPGTLILAIASSTPAAPPSLKAPPQVASYVIEKLPLPASRAEEPELVFVITAEELDEQDAPQRPDPPPVAKPSYPYKPLRVLAGRSAKPAAPKRHAAHILGAIGRKLKVLERDGGVQ